jgi:hypothetical protein
LKTTYEILLAKYGERHVPLVKFCEYFGVTDEKHLKTLAVKNKLGGIRAFKLRESRDAPLFVDLENVADIMDKKAIAARE